MKPKPKHKRSDKRGHRQLGSCILWTGSTDGQGYGIVIKNGKVTKAHRIAYETKFGKIPNGLVVDHLCRITLCVNPDHIEAVTIKENVLRGFGPPAINKRKTHCIRGHLLSGDNLLEHGIKRGERVCRKCMTFFSKNRDRSIEHEKRMFQRLMIRHIEENL